MSNLIKQDSVAYVIEGPMKPSDLVKKYLERGEDWQTINIQKASHSLIEDGIWLLEDDQPITIPMELASQYATLLGQRDILKLSKEFPDLVAKVLNAAAYTTSSIDVLMNGGEAVAFQHTSDEMKTGDVISLLSKLGGSIVRVIVRRYGISCFITTNTLKGVYPVGWDIFISSTAYASKLSPAMFLGSGSLTVGEPYADIKLPRSIDVAEIRNAMTENSGEITRLMRTDLTKRVNPSMVMSAFQDVSLLGVWGDLDKKFSTVEEFLLKAGVLQDQLTPDRRYRLEKLMGRILYDSQNV